MRLTGMPKPFDIIECKLSNGSSIQGKIREGTECTTL